MVNLCREDHDFGLALPHTVHHRQISRVYTVYTKWNDGDSKNDTVLNSIKWGGAEPEEFLDFKRQQQEGKKDS